MRTYMYVHTHTHTNCMFSLRCKTQTLKHTHIGKMKISRRPVWKNKAPMKGVRKQNRVMRG